MAEDYSVKEGESVNSIAVQHGFDWHTLWNRSENATLKQNRKDPDTLLAGDVLHIPDRGVKEVSKSSNAHYKFKVKGRPAKFKLILLKDPDPSKDKLERVEKSDPWKYVEKPYPGIKGKPFKDVSYRLLADGKLVKQGTTGASGTIETKLSPTATDGILVLFPGKPEERSIELNFRHMDPLETTQGVCKRLNNLGCGCPVDSTVTSPVAQAIRQFQTNEKLTADGQLTDETRNKLKSVHGG